MAKVTEPRHRALGGAVLPLLRQRDLIRSAALPLWWFKWFKQMTKRRGSRRNWHDLE